MSIGTRIIRNSGYLALGSQSANLLQFVFFLYFARVFGESAVGQYSFGFSFTFAFTIFADLGISIYLIREVARDTSGTRRLFAKGLILRLVSLFIVLVLSLAIFPFLSADFSPESIRIIVMLGLYQVSFSLTELFMGELKGREEMGIVAVVGLLGKVVVTACGFGLIFLGFDYSTVLIAFPIGGFASLAAAYVVSRVRLGPLTLRLGPPSELKKMLVEVLPFGFAFVLVQGIYCQDVIILRFFKGDASVGIYSVAVKFAAFILAGSVFLYETILPILSKLYVESREEFMRVARQILRYLVMCSLPLATGMAALADRIIAVLYQDRFSGSVGVLRIAAWVVALGMTQVVYSAVMTAVNRQGAKAVCWGISLIIAIGANLVLIRAFDFIGAAIARLAIEVLTLAAFVYLTSRYAGPLSLLSAYVRPMLACAAMAAFIYRAHDWNLAVLVAVSGLVYVLVMLALGAFSRTELRRFRDVCLDRMPAFGALRR